MDDGPQNATISVHANVKSTIENIIEDQTVHFPTTVNSNIEKRSDNGEIY